MNILLAGGGTGGHVYPALALIEELRKRQRNIRIGYVGTGRGLESSIMRREPDIEFFEIEASGVERQFSAKTFKETLINLKGLSRSLKVLTRFDPDVVLGTGGYVSFAPLFWGALLGYPTLIHEQNRDPGLVNRLLAPHVGSVMVTYPETTKKLRAKRAVCTGLPLRASISSIGQHVSAREARETLGLAPDQPLVLVMGGTHGAKVIHDQLLENFDRLSRKGVQLAVLAGRDAERVQAQVSSSPGLHIVGHTHDVARWMRAADVMICRAGGSTLAEMTALRVPAIVIPWPGAANNHQEANAAWLAERGACRLLKESDCHGQRLIDEAINLLGDPESLAELRNCCANISNPHATELVMREVVRQLEYGRQREAIPLYRNWRRWNERLGLDTPPARAFRQRFGL